MSAAPPSTWEKSLFKMKRSPQTGAKTIAGKRSRFAFTLAVFACWLALTNAGCTATVDEGDAVEPLERRTVADMRIDESSGLAASTLVADRFWTHNDSGDVARLFAIDKSNAEPPNAETSVAKTSVVAVEGVTATDWEDMASGTIAGKRLLFIGDVGDNSHRRKSVFLHVIEETIDLPVRTNCRTIEVTYSDGPGDCEAIGIDAQNNRLLLIKKTLLPLAGVYEVDLTCLNQNPEVSADDLSADNSVPAKFSAVAKRIATLPIPMITGMDIRSDGRQMAIATYRDLFVYHRAADASWEETLAQVPRQAVLPKLRQIEAICYDSAGEIWITSERAPMPLARIDSRPFLAPSNPETSPNASDSENRNSKNGKE